MSSPRIFVLTGAGISAESGIATFRAADGLWENHRVEEVATPEGFSQDPALVHRFYSERRAQVATARPNAAHRALADYQATHPGRLSLVTQNVDDLHERGGSGEVLHMHGSLLQMRCTATGEVYPWSGPSSPRSVCDCCGAPGRLRPHIVWFGEMPMYMPEIEARLAETDIFVSIGTSGNVYPAAGFAALARASGARTVELNLDPSQNANSFDDGEYGPATELVPRFFASL